jgi:Ca-activated chloride channel homolog
MSDLRFDHPVVLHLLWIVPALGVVFLWGFHRKRAAMGAFATENLLTFLVPSVSVARQKFKAMLLICAVLLLVFALAGPRWGTHYQDIPARGIDLMFVLDVSNSMLAEDVSPNRLERAKLDIRDMLGVLAGDRVGLVTFAGESTVTCPLTTNYGSFRLALDVVDTRSAPRGGTNLGDAVRRAVASFVDEVPGHKAIVVISDGGETDESYATEAARNAFVEKGIRVFTVGFGDVVEGARIPVVRNGRRTYLKHEGQEVWTKLDPGLLQSMAGAADGGYFSNVGFQDMYDRIRRKVAPREFETTRRELQYARFHWFAGAALLLLMMETVVSDRKVAR